MAIVHLARGPPPGAPPPSGPQVFSKTVIGPIFFEFIQRKGDDGFGDGNFRALFESIEADRIARRFADRRLPPTLAPARPAGAAPVVVAWAYARWRRHRDRALQTVAELFLI